MHVLNCSMQTKLSGCGERRQFLKSLKQCFYKGRREQLMLKITGSF